MDSKFLGVGLQTAIMLWLFVVLMTLIAKTVFTKYEVPGLSKIFQAV